MIGSASNWRQARIRALALLLPALALAACGGGGDQAMAEKLAAAQAAADKAVAAQHAAERAAAAAANSRAPVAMEPAQSLSDSFQDGEHADGPEDSQLPDIPLPGAPGQTIDAEGTVIPG
jgi:hypothetical protein